MKRPRYLGMTPKRRSASTELQWLPDPELSAATDRSRRDDFAIVNAALELDWTAINPLPVRKSPGVRHHFTPAEYYWQRTHRFVWCESQNERWEALWLDFGGQIENLWSQPLAIHFGKGSKLAGESHFPDFLGLTTEGGYALFDVKPRDQIDEHDELQFGETAKVCRLLGWHFQVLEGHNPHATQNLYCISASRHVRCEPDAPTQFRILQAAINGATRGELCEVAAPECPPLACAWVDNLTWRRLLRVDLAAIFRNDTVYTTASNADAQARYV
ncbi:hypothetical protein [Microbacterium sp. LEMMJ01]|uniref:hypothetical protein n=1 Tax=Microbacterium sp. LEMMJ01 TaxID=1978350 RepID=UPI001557542F|nr:hypothetical protein [Microbacterium sp. LEMMJ01]